MEAFNKLIAITGTFGLLTYFKLNGGSLFFTQFYNIGNLIGYPSFIIGTSLIILSLIFNGKAEDYLSKAGTSLIFFGYLLYIALWISKYWMGL